MKFIYDIKSMVGMLLVAFSLIFTNNAFAGGGWACCTVGISINNGSLYQYSLANEEWADGEWIFNTPFDAHNFGTPTSLVLNGGIGNAWSDDSPGYTAESFKLFYRVYKTSGTPGSWNQINLDNVNFKNGNNYIYDKTTANIDLLSLANAGSGIYTLEVVMSKNQFYRHPEIQA